jgi:hypothetical protein
VRAASIDTEERSVSTGGLPTIWELVAEAAEKLPEPFSRAALINWISARRPDVGVASIAKDIQAATANAAHPSGRTPLLHRVDRGLYRRYRADVEDGPPVDETGRVVLVGSSGAVAGSPRPARELFLSDGFARAREHALRSGRRWFVLSAKHGLLDPDDVVGPFDVLFGDQPTGYRAAWAEWVVVQLADRVRLPGTTVEVHGGVDFAQALRAPLARRGARTEIPLPGGWSPDAHDETEHQPPVRAAFGKLLGFVSRH